MENLTAVISENIFLETEQITDLRYESEDTFVLIDNCGDHYRVRISKIA